MSPYPFPVAAFACMCVAAITTSAAQQAWAAPDLIINVQDSRITPGTCDESSPIVTGRIAIKNAGDDTAALRVTERFTRSMLAVYVPHNIDMIDKKSERQKLEPYDQQGISFEVGAGVVKKGRRFSAYTDSTPDNFDDQERQSQRARGRAIQTALDKIGFDPGGIDGIIGRNTRAAIREFQESIGDSRTGTLTADQERKLFSKAGTGVEVGSEYTTGARGETEVTIYAVVDPYNLVTESNEANNLQIFKFTVDCGQ